MLVSPNPPPTHPAIPPPKRPTSRHTILSSLRSQTLRIEGLHATFSPWPFATNPALPALRTAVSHRLNTLFPSHPKLAKLLAGDYALFGATWWPHAPPDRLTIATYLSIWLFMWDDEIDSDAGRLATNLPLAAQYRADTITHVRTCLGLSPPSQTPPTNPVIASFADIGAALRAACPPQQLHTFATELAFFMEKSAVEQRQRLTPHLASLDDFWRFRLGTSAVRVVLAINEYANALPALPARVRADADFARLWDLVNVNICSVNDLLSVRKEVEQGGGESLVPILYAEMGDVQAAVEQVVRTVRVTVEEFEVVAGGLLGRFGGVGGGLEGWVQGCRFYCTGNLRWSLETGRYGVFQELGRNEIFIRL